MSQRLCWVSIPKRPKFSYLRLAVVEIHEDMRSGLFEERHHSVFTSDHMDRLSNLSRILISNVWVPESSG